MSSQFITRPALRTVATSHAAGTYRLRLTIVFHPDLDRIGTYVDVHCWAIDKPLTVFPVLFLGRNEPLLSDNRALEDMHISRRALRIEQRHRATDVSGLSLSLQAVREADIRIGASGASECLVDGIELKRGIPLRFGHGVVALLRLVGPVNDVPASNVAPSLLGTSVELSQGRAVIASVAQTELPVLILGESGVGKELVASAIHEGSARCNNKLVSINMAAIPAGLAASELFGAEKGAFTGAQTRRGYFREAQGGSLFLDEIADTPEEIQVQLLRALDQGEIQVVGGKTEPIDARVIAATDGAITEAAGFRHALLNRLAGCTIAIPPLRDRLEDIGPQGAHLLVNYAADHPDYPFLACRDNPQVAAHWARFFFDALLHDWPGNSRELVFALQRAALIHPEPSHLRVQREDEQSPRVEMIDDDQLFDVHKANVFEVQSTADELGWSRSMLYRRIETHPTLRLARDIADQEIHDVLARFGNSAEAAYALGISISALRPRLKKLSVRD